MHGAGCHKRERAGDRKNPRLASLRTGTRASAATLIEAAGELSSLRRIEEEHLKDAVRLRDLERLLARAWAISDTLVDAAGPVGDHAKSAPFVAALLGSTRLIGETLERVARLEGQCSLTEKHVDALALGMLGLFQRYVQEDKVDAALLEIEPIFDSAFGSPRVRLSGMIRP